MPMLEITGSQFSAIKDALGDLLCVHSSCTFHWHRPGWIMTEYGLKDSTHPLLRCEREMEDDLTTEKWHRDYICFEKGGSDGH